RLSTRRMLLPYTTLFRSLFHSRFRNYYAELYGGVRNTSWADELRVGVTAFHIDRQNQFGARMEQPFGAATGRQYSIIPTLRYQKDRKSTRLNSSHVKISY